MTEPNIEPNTDPNLERPESGRQAFVSITDEIANEPQPPRRSKLVAWATLGAVGAAAVVGGVVATHGSGGSPITNAALARAAAATSPAPAPSPSAPHNNKGGRRGPGGPGMGPRVLGGPGGLGILGLGGKVLHGESTVATGGGGTEIVDTQSGTISAIDTTAKTITVTSTDKAAFSYVVGAKARLVDFAASSPMKTTLADLKVGDTVGVVATRSGDTRTATSVIDGVPTRKNRPVAPPSA